MLKTDFSKLGGNPLRLAWDRLRNLPGGRAVFSRLVGEVAPYTGTLGAQVEDLREGYARLRLVQRRRITNHLNSVHAIALMNLGEMCTGVAVMYGMPDSMRGIPTKLEMEYFRKSRGVLIAECTCEPVREGETYDYPVKATVRNEDGELCGEFTALWRISPK